jgi:excinuclease ABC subunit C
MTVTDGTEDDLANGADGRAVIRAQLKTLPASPGVYRMLDGRGDALYVGKARNLKKRVASYVNPSRQSDRIARMVRSTRALEIITTHTEVEALLLEANLIKRLKPRYNVILRDDKSFPYILITGDGDWAQIAKHRGARNLAGEYFGPFASAKAVNRTINALQRAFPLRSCSDSIFAGRTRPCLQYQIKRCTAPCVGRIGADDYAVLVQEARDFLAGKTDKVQRRMSEKMQAASADLDFETAAVYRDRIRALTHIQARQDINVTTLPEADVIASHQKGGQTCIQVFFFRHGHNYGNRAYFPSHAKQLDEAEVLEAFVAQFYDNKPPPKLVLLSHRVSGRALIEEALSVRAGRRVRVEAPQRGVKHKLVRHAAENARDALERRLAASASQRRLLEGVAELFDLDGTPGRIEVYDNSHISGSNAVGAMIVAGAEGLLKNAYRKFNIKREDLSPGDDYGMMREVLNRRFTRLLREDDSRDKGQWPDLVLIDGGAGQLAAAQEVIDELGVDDVALAAIAKGPERNAGRERLFLRARAPFALDPRDPVLYFLQRLRDEAHRFAIGTHRAKRSAAMGKSALDEIAGVGARRKRAAQSLRVGPWRRPGRPRGSGARRRHQSYHGQDHLRSFPRRSLRVI